MNSEEDVFFKNNEYSELQIQKEYNANFIIKGTIQTVLNQSRLNLQLVDLKQNKVVWSDKKEFDLKDIFKVQDKIGNKILKHLQIKGVTGSTGSMFAKKFKNIEILWASVREPYNYTQAKQLGCDIITIPPSTIEKIEKFGKSFDQLTIETVKAFLIDSKKSNFKI